MHYSNVSKSIYESEHFFNMQSLNRIKRVYLKQYPNWNRSLLRIFYKALFVIFISSKWESWVCLPNIKHFIYAVIKCLSFFGIFDKKLNIYSAFLFNEFDDNLRFDCKTVKWPWPLRGVYFFINSEFREFYLIVDARVFLRIILYSVLCIFIIASS